MKRSGAFLLSFSMALGMFAVFSVGAGAATSPTFVPGNPSCTSLGYDFGFKVDPPDSGTYTVPGVGTITVDADDIAFDWSSTFGIDAVIVKGGPNANLYVYDPPSESTGDSDLQSPNNPANNQPYGLSHIEFCYDLEPDLDISKEVSDTTVDEGGAFSYTITVENTGDAAATNVVVTDDLDNNLTVVSVTPSQGTCDPVGPGNTIGCDLGTLTAGGSATVTINATAPQLPLTEGGVCEISIANTAFVDSDQTDEVSDNAPLITVTGTGCDEAPELDITKTASTTQVNEGGAFSYTIEVENTGDASATNVVVTDDVDDNLTGVSVTPSQGTCDPVGAGNTIGCDLGTLDAGGSATVTINATAPQLPLAGTNVCQISIANTASVDSAETAPVSGSAPSVTVTGTGCETGGGGAPPPPPPPPGEISVDIVKTNDADGDGTYTNSEEALEPGSNVSFLLVITNTSDEVVTITSLTDAFPGSSIDLLANKCSALAGVSLDPGESVDCTFSIQDYSPDATADPKINTATVCVENANGTQEACDDNDSRVTSAEVLGGTVTRSPTRTPPAGLAFTGPDDGSTNWIIVAFLLLLIGTTLMYFGSPPEEELEG
jgi:uncharacterized repeat protein (TIGR01451 family)